MKGIEVSYRFGGESCDKERSIESRDGSNKDGMIGEAQDLAEIYRWKRLYDRSRGCDRCARARR